jgi:site-specific DNA-cytosine methylase
MKVLVACEESQAVTIELRKLGHEAYSNDIIECSGGHPEWHIQGDSLVVIEREHWDMIIAFPPCTHLSLSGAKHFEKKRITGVQAEGIEFFAKILNSKCERIAVENPANIMSGGDYLKKHYPELCEMYSLPRVKTQAIQPYEHGDNAQKTTWLWLKGLPELTPTNIVDKGEFVTTPSGKRLPKWYSDNKSGKNRSKTFPGIAKAMAEQWSK